MIAKGHDFPGVSVVGVISADTALNLPDFRSSERTFGLLTQVAGRAGRENSRGRVYIQTFIPDHYAVQSAKDHDYLEFYEKEMKFREELQLPPYRHVVQVIIGGRDEKVVLKRSHEFKKNTEKDCEEKNITILGPAPCLVSKRRNFYLWNLHYRAEDVFCVNDILRQALNKLDRTGVMITIDVDPR
jgi:primosomal protein N' (replication factor Y)